MGPEMCMLSEGKQSLPSDKQFTTRYDSDNLVCKLQLYLDWSEGKSHVPRDTRVSLTDKKASSIYRHTLVVDTKLSPTIGIIWISSSQKTNFFKVTIGWTSLRKS